MPDIPIRTWKDLLFFPDGQETCIPLLRVDDTDGYTPSTSAFNPAEWELRRLPSHVHLVEDFLSRMHEDLNRVLEEHYAVQAGGTFVMAPAFTGSHRRGHWTPDDVLYTLWEGCARLNFRINYERDVETIAEYVYRLVESIHYALTEKIPEFTNQQPTHRSVVITDHVYKLDGAIKILWEDKPPKVFDTFVGQLVNEIRARESGINPYPELSPAAYNGYRAILAKLSYHSSDIQPPVRWAVLFSGFRYIVIYIPRLSQRPTFYCSPIIDCCVRPDSPQGLAEQLPPPIWSIVVYMLLTESLNISDDTLRQRFRLPASSGDMSSNLGASYDTAGHRWRSRSLMTTSQPGGDSGKLTKTPGDMVVQFFNGLPMGFSPAGTPQSQDGEKQRPFVFLDRYLGGGWSSVYASSTSHLIVKLARAPKKNKAELERQLRNENDVYKKLYRLTGLVVPRCYGEYVWYGGRALVLSDEGPSMSDLEMEFTSLGLVERLILFWELYFIHYFGVNHRDFAPRNVLRKGWCRLTIIDFAFSNVDHTCPGWKECGELKDLWHKLELEGLAFRHRNGMPGTIQLVASIIFGLLVTRIYMFLVSFTPSANPPVVGPHVD